MTTGFGHGPEPTGATAAGARRRTGQSQSFTLTFIKVPAAWLPAGQCQGD